MPRVCTVCSHPERAAIDAALVAGEAYRSIAKRFGISEPAVFRHRRDHIPAALAQATAAAEVAQADDLLGQLRDLQRRTLAILDKAERGENLPAALKAIGEARRNLELVAKLVGELQEGTTVNVLVAPEWLALRARLVAALAPFPQARVAVAEVLADAG